MIQHKIVQVQEISIETVNNMQNGRQFMNKVLLNDVVILITLINLEGKRMKNLTNLEIGKMKASEQ